MQNSLLTSVASVLARLWRDTRGGGGSFTPSVNAFRFYEDGTESGSTPIDAQNTNVTIDPTGTYDANGVNFDGTNDYLINSSLTSISDSKLWTASFWFRRGSTGANHVIVAGSNPGFIQFRIRFDGSNDRLHITGFNTSNTFILDITSSVITDTSSWHHAMFSVDLANASNRHLYIDDTSALNVTTYTDDTIEFSTSEGVSVGATLTAGGKFDGDIADLWFQPGLYIDLSVEANRRKFINSSGNPVELKDNGSGPTGTAPVMFFRGATADWHTNAGTGGGFTENGALTDASADPTQGSSFGDKIGLRYRIDETGGKNGSNTDDYKLQYDKNSASSWTDVTATSSNVQVLLDADSTLTDGGATTNRATDGISDPAAGSFVASETEVGDGEITDFQLTADDFTEAVWGLRLVNADLANNDTLDFRVVLNGGTPGITNAVTPRITISKGASTTNVSPAATATGVVIVRVSADRTFTVTADAGSDLTIEAQKSFAATATGVAAVTVQKVFTRLLEATAAGIASLQKQANLILAPVATGVVALQKQANRAFAATATAATALQKQANLALSIFKPLGVSPATSAYLETTSISGTADSKTGHLSFWVQTSDASTQYIYHHRGDVGEVEVFLFGGNVFLIAQGATTANQLFTDFESSGAGLSDGQPHHVAMSWRTSTLLETLQCYVDGVDVLAGTATVDENEEMDWTGHANHYVGRHHTTNNPFDNGCIWELVINSDEFLDLSTSAIQSYRSTDGTAVDLGADGSAPTGNQPAMYFRGGGSFWGTNLGYAGNFSQNGSFNDCANSEISGGLATVSVQLVFVRALTAVATGVAALQKQASRAFAATATGTAALQKQANRAFTATATGIAALQKQANLFLSRAATGVADVVVQLISGATEVTLNAVATGVAAVQITAQLTRAAIATGIAVVDPMAVIGVVLAAVATGVATLQKQANRTFSVVATGAADVTLLVQKTLSAIGQAIADVAAQNVFVRVLVATATGVTTIQLQVSKTLAAIATGAAAVALKNTFLRAFSATATGVAAVQLQVSKTFAAVASGVAALQKQANLLLGAVASGVANIGVGSLFKLTLNATASGVATVVTLFLEGFGRARAAGDRFYKQLHGGLGKMIGR